MRALFSSARPQRIAAALAAVTIASCGASVAFAGSAMAVGNGNGHHQSCTTTPDITYTWNGTNTFTAVNDNGIAPCADVTVNVTSYNLPTSWDGAGWDASAAPQTEFATTTLTIPANTIAPVSVTVSVPTCGSYQADAYTGAVQSSVSFPDGTIDYLAGNIVKQAACGTDVTAGPSFTDASCSTSTVGYTIPPVTGVDFYVQIGSAPAVLDTSAGAFVPDTIGDTVVITAVAQPGYSTPTGYPTGGWSHTFAPVTADCDVTPPPTTPPTLTVTPVPSIPTGSIIESCPTAKASTEEMYAVTLNNPAAVTGVTGTPMLFQISVNGGVIATSTAIAEGSSYTFPGTLPIGTAATVTASFQAVGATTWTPVVLTGSQKVFPCAAVLGETIVKPTAVKPVAFVKPVATLPFTGLPTVPTALVGFALVAGGAGLILVARKKDSLLG